ADDVVDVNPGKPLAAAADLPGDAQLERRQHLSERSAVTAQYDAGAKQDGANARLCCGSRLAFPLFADVGHKTGSGRRAFVEFLVAAIAVEADGRTADQHRRRSRQSEQAGYQVSAADHTRIDDSPLLLLGPALCCDGLADEVHCSIHIRES